MNLQHLQRLPSFPSYADGNSSTFINSNNRVFFFGKSEIAFRWPLSVFTALSCFIYSKSIFFSAPVSPFWIAWNPPLKLCWSFWILFYTISILLISGRSERNKKEANFNTFNALIVSLADCLIIPWLMPTKNILKFLAGYRKGRLMISAAVPALMSPQTISGLWDFPANITGVENFAGDVVCLDVPNDVSLVRLLSTHFALPSSLLITLRGHKVVSSYLHHGIDLVAQLIFVNFGTPSLF